MGGIIGIAVRYVLTAIDFTTCILMLIIFIYFIEQITYYSTKWLKNTKLKTSINTP